MSRSRAIRAVLAALAAGLALLAGATSGGAAPSPWATVNVCDTTGHPDGIGIRAWMPGAGDKREELFMRLQLQFLRRSDNAWRALGGSGDSGFVDVGNGSRADARAGARSRSRRRRTASRRSSCAGSPRSNGAATATWSAARAARRPRAMPARSALSPGDYSAATCSIR